MGYIMAYIGIGYLWHVAHEEIYGETDLFQTIWDVIMWPFGIIYQIMVALINLGYKKEGANEPRPKN